MIDKILEIMKKISQIMSRNGREYRILSKDIRKKCKKAKDEWLNMKYAEIETLWNIRQQECIKR